MVRWPQRSTRSLPSSASDVLQQLQQLPWGQGRVDEQCSIKKIVLPGRASDRFCLVGTTARCDFDQGVFR